MVKQSAEKGTLIKRAGVRTPWTPTLDPPLHWDFGSMGGATDFKVGYKTGFASGASEKNVCTSHFSKCAGYKQSNISRGLLNTLKFAV